MALNLTHGLLPEVSTQPCMIPLEAFSAAAERPLGKVLSKMDRRLAVSHAEPGPSRCENVLL